MPASKTMQYDIKTTTYKTTWTASAYLLTIDKLETLYDELTFVVEFHVANDASAMLEINSLWAMAIMKSDGTAVEAGDLKTTGRYTLVYDQGTWTAIVSETVDSDVEETVNATISVGWINCITPVIPWITTTRFDSVRWDGTYYYIVDGVWLRKYDIQYNLIWTYVNATLKSIVLDWWYIYASSEPNRTIYKIETSTMTVVDSYYDTNIQQPWLVKCWNYLVFGYNGNRLGKIDLTTFTYIDASAAITDQNHNLTSDGTYVYSQDDWYGAVVNKVDISTRTVVGSQGFPWIVWWVLYSDGYIYVGYDGKLYRIPSTTMWDDELVFSTTTIENEFTIVWWYIYIKYTDAVRWTHVLIKIDSNKNVIGASVDIQAWTILWWANWKVFTTWLFGWMAVLTVW